jgi:hypothetical protein
MNNTDSMIDIATACIAAHAVVGFQLYCTFALITVSDESIDHSLLLAHTIVVWALLVRSCELLSIQRDICAAWITCLALPYPSPYDNTRICMLIISITFVAKYSLLTAIHIIEVFY